MNRTDKLNEGQVQIDDIHNYRPLDNPMVGTTAIKVHRLIQSLLQEGHIDDMTAKWLSLTPDPPRIPVFYTLTKIQKPTIFRLFELLVFVGQKDVSSIQNIVDLFLAYISQKEKLEKWPCSDENHELKNWEKCQFFECFYLMFVQPTKAFFPSRISLKTFSWPLLHQKKSSNNGHFWT